MSQTPNQVCPQCSTRVEQGNRFCPNCGTPLAQPPDPTVAAAPSPPSPSEANSNYNPYASSPSAPNYLSIANTPSNPSYPTYPTPTAPASTDQTPYPMYNSTPVTPPPAPSDPYSAQAAQGPYYAPPPPAPKGKKGMNLPLVILLGVLLVALLGTGGYFAFLRNNTHTATGGNNGINGNTSDTGNGNFSDTNTINLTTTYSSDEITFNKIQQAAKFKDDDYTNFTYTGSKNYVRVNFKEKQTAKNGSYFSYTSAFRLKLPAGDTVKATKASDYSAPESGVQRDSWIDFGTTEKVDLANLTLILGADDEQQMTIPLKTGADLSKYQPKQSSPNKQFQYAGIDWTVTGIQQSLYNDGKQAKSGKVYLVVQLSADNKRDDLTVYLSDFLRLKTGDSILSPELDSNLYDLDIIRPNTSNTQGTAVFLVPQDPNGKYTLQFQKGDKIDEVDVDIQVS